MSSRRPSVPDPITPRGRAPCTQLTAAELEIADGFKIAYEGASTQRRRSRVLQEYVAHYAHVAFHPDSWLFPLWISWRAVGEDAGGPERAEAQREARLGLKAIQRGIVEPVSGYVGGWVIGPRGHQELRDGAAAKARTELRRVRQDRQIKTAYRHWRGGRDDPEYQHYLSLVGRRAWELLVGPHPAASPVSSPALHPLLAEAELNTWHSRQAVFVDWIGVFQNDIRDHGLSRALSALVARVHRIPERDLH